MILVLCACVFCCSNCPGWEDIDNKVSKERFDACFEESHFVQEARRWEREGPWKPRFVHEFAGFDNFEKWHDQCGIEMRKKGEEMQRKAEEERAKTPLGKLGIKGKSLKGKVKSELTEKG